MTAHTPETIAALLAGTTEGPWRKSEIRRGRAIINSNGRTIGAAHELGVGREAESNANRSLIAAAPTLATELSAALVREKALVAMFRVNMLRYGPPGTTHEMIDALIADALATEDQG